MSTPLNNSILKAVSILDLFDDKRQELTARDVAELGDMNGACRKFSWLTAC